MNIYEYLNLNNMNIDDGIVSTIKGTGAQVKVEYFQGQWIKERLATGQHARNTGSAYVFIRMVDQWVQESSGRLIAGDSRAGDQFGFSTAIDADRSIVGAPYAVSDRQWMYSWQYIFRYSDILILTMDNR